MAKTKKKAAVAQKTAAVNKHERKFTAGELKRLKATGAKVDPSLLKAEEPKKATKAEKAKKAKVAEISAKINETLPKPKEKPQSKKDQAIAMLADGATLAQMEAKFGWQRHTVRGFLSILGKTHNIEMTQNADKVRSYRLVG